MGLKGWNLGILAAIGVLWFAGFTQREKPVVGQTHKAQVASLEDHVAESPGDAARIRALAQGYLDARASGMALAAIERAPASVRAEPTVDHLYARALLEQGRSADALAAERRVLAMCLPAALPSPCSNYLIASATRRADILEQLVSLGVEDANSQPEASNLAYHNATRQVSFQSTP